MSVAVSLLVGCSADEAPPELLLDGPAEVRVQGLGPVPAPRLATSTGVEPHPIWQFSRPGVVDVAHDGLVARGPGEVDVTAEWEGSTVSFTVVVLLDSEILLPTVPARLGVGERRPLEAVVRVVGDPASQRALAADEVQWVYEGTGLRLEGSEVVGVAPGVTWIVARAQGAEAMAEIEVVAGDVAVAPSP